MRHSSSRFSPSTKGFTLIELLMAIAIAAIALAIVNASFFQSHRTIESVKGQRENYQMIRIVMDRIIKDLTCAYVPYTDDAMTEEEISGYRFEGTNDTDLENDTDSVYFTTTADLGLPSLSGGICEVGYYLEEMEENKDLYTLIRMEECTPHYGTSETPARMEIAENVVALDIVYVDKNYQDKDEWSLEDKLYLPRQIKITITFAGREEPFEVTGTVSLPLSSIQVTKE